MGRLLPYIFIAISAFTTRVRSRGHTGFNYGFRFMLTFTCFTGFNYGIHFTSLPGGRIYILKSGLWSLTRTLVHLLNPGVIIAGLWSAHSSRGATALGRLLSQPRGFPTSISTRSTTSCKGFGAKWPPKNHLRATPLLRSAVRVRSTSPLVASVAYWLVLYRISSSWSASSGGVAHRSTPTTAIPTTLRRAIVSARETCGRVYDACTIR